MIRLSLPPIGSTLPEGTTSHLRHSATPSVVSLNMAGSRACENCSNSIKTDSSARSSRLHRNHRQHSANKYRSVKGPTVEEHLFGERNATAKSHLRRPDVSKSASPSSSDNPSSTESQFLQLNNNNNNQNQNQNQKESTILWDKAPATVHKITVPYIPPTGKFTLFDKELARELIEHDAYRNKPINDSAIISFKDYERLKSYSTRMTRQEIIAQQIREQEKAKLESEERVQFLKRIDYAKIRTEKLSDLEAETLEHSKQFLKMAQEQRDGQDDEIKRLDEFVHEAKVQAIRDAQVAEKTQIEKEKLEEIARLDAIMEKERQNGIALQEAIEQRRREDERICALQVIKQVEENECRRLMDEEKRCQEALAERLQHNRLLEEEYQKQVERAVLAEKRREEMNATNEELRMRKYREFEIEKMCDFQTIMFQREQTEREEALQREKERLALEREKEVSKMRLLQQRVRDEKAERDAIAAKRIMEERERKMRQKELLDAQKRKAAIEELQRGREEQQRQQMHFLAMQATRDRKAYEDYLMNQKELSIKLLQEDERAKKRKAQYAEDLRDQIRQKEHEQLEARRNFFKEGETMKAEVRLRKARFEEMRQKRLSDLRKAGVPEKYLARVERACNAMALKS